VSSGSFTKKKSILRLKSFTIKDLRAMSLNSCRPEKNQSTFKKPKRINSPAIKVVPKLFLDGVTDCTLTKNIANAMVAVMVEKTIRVDATLDSSELLLFAEAMAFTP
tara:strand:+ start:106 stop:426 length:321 start_codon:yes stop_codon:yes gene_type:complete